MDSQVAAEIGDKTVALISTIYGDTPGGELLTYSPANALPSWLRWQPEAAKVSDLRPKPDSETDSEAKTACNISVTSR